MANNGWIGVDLDGTLAVYDQWRGLTHIGPPVPAMVERVKGWLANGLEVRIFTARMSMPHGYALATFIKNLNEFCQENVGQVLLATNVKDFDMLELWDDRAVQVEENTGRPLGPSRLGHV